MTPLAFFATVKRAQKEFGVEQFDLGGTNHWMIIRLLLLTNLAHEANRRVMRIVGKSAHSRMIDNPLAAIARNELPPNLYNQRVIGKSAILFEMPSRPLINPEVVFFELPVDYTQSIGGKAVNRIADGFVEAFGRSVHKICRFSPDIFDISCHADPNYIFLALAALDIPYADRRRFASAVRSFCAYLTREAPEFVISPAQVMLNVGLTLRRASAHEAWLQEVKPQLVAFQCFVSMEKIALLIACQRLGIPTMEVQHGFCDTGSVFNEMPPSRPNGKAQLPDMFWCWGEATTSALKADAGIKSNDVNIMLGGDVWGSLAATRAATGGCAAFLKQIGADAYARRILLGYQVEAVVHTDERPSLIPPFLLESMTQMPRTYLWMIRVHPRSSHLIEPIKQILLGAGVTNVEIEVTTLEPIENVLEAADIYLTGFSVSALEANALGKPVILIDKFGEELYADLIADGVFGYASTAAALCSQIEQMRKPTRDVGYYRRDLNYSRQVFGDLVRKLAARDAPGKPSEGEPRDKVVAIGNGAAEAGGGLDAITPPPTIANEKRSLRRSRREVVDP